MTIICSDGKTMAADGLQTRDDLVIHRRRSKLHRLPGGGVLGCAGDASAIELVVGWFMAGEPKDTIPVLRGAEFKALILRRPGHLQLMDQLFAPFDVDPPQAIGSGDLIAMGALGAGLSPRRAVAVTIHLCTSTGGVITTKQPTARTRR